MCITLTWNWLSELSNHTKQWLQCTIGLACYSYFQFTSPSAPGDVLDPSLLAEDAEGKVVFMELRDDPIPLCADDLEIAFKGFGQHGNVETTLDDFLFDFGEIGTTPPLNLLAGETDSEEDGSPK